MTNTLLAGAARVNITPDPAMKNWIDQKPYDGVLDPIYTRALVLSDGEQQVALLCWDLIDATEESVASVRQAASAATGIPEGHILVNASHTHSAPRAPFTRATLSSPTSRRATVLDDPVFQEWASRLPASCAEVVKQAQAAMRPVSLAIGRAHVGEWIFNRRPRTPEGTVVSMMRPEDPHSLPDGLRFGPVDPTLTLLAFRDEAGQAVATLYHMACHGVAIYVAHRGVSGDWPGPTTTRIASILGGEVLFLQGCCGDLVPARRGVENRDRMSEFIAERAVAAAARAHPLPSAPLQVALARIGLPLTQKARADLGRDHTLVEIQGIACGSLALVALPGEPLIGLSLAIQERSPFPHTLVAGYSNGRGVGYVGLPGEKARGGYEAGAGSGEDECGQLLIETAARLLRQLHGT